jgi:SAM domain (Sterile alpha motif)
VRSMKTIAVDLPCNYSVINRVVSWTVARIKLINSEIVCLSNAAIHRLMSEDPRDWSVDEVEAWAQRTFLFGSSLSEHLRDHDVDGSVLLSHVTDETLKNDIGIRSLGQRVKVVQSIAELLRVCGIPLL